MLLLALHLTLAAAPTGLHLLPPGAPAAERGALVAQFDTPAPALNAAGGGLSAPPIVPFDGERSRAPLAVGEALAAELKELTLKVRALTEQIRRLGPNWPVGPTLLVCLGLLGGYYGLTLLPAFLLSGAEVLVAAVFATVVLAVLGLGVYWGYASWVANSERRAELIKERDELQRRLDDATFAPTAPPVPSIPSVQAGPRPTVLLARF